MEKKQFNILVASFLTSFAFEKTSDIEVVKLRYKQILELIKNEQNNNNNNVIEAKQRLEQQGYNVDLMNAFVKDLIS